jgi:hypothetical protein
LHQLSLKLPKKTISKPACCNKFKTAQTAVRMAAAINKIITIALLTGNYKTLQHLLHGIRHKKGPPLSNPLIFLKSISL